MLTIISSLLGFIGAALPEVLKLLRDAQDKRHELAVMDRQVRLQKQGHMQRLEAIDGVASAAEIQALYQTYQSHVKWVDALNGTVRPVLAYAFFLLYAYIKFHQAQETPWLLWQEDDRAIFAGIISFYFGQRTMQKYWNQRSRKGQ